MSSKARYQQIFSSPLFQKVSEDIREEINETIDWARDVLKKDDKIVWFLRVYKFSLINSAVLDWNDPHPDFVMSNRNKRKLEIIPFSEPDIKWVRRFLHENEHAANEIKSPEWHGNASIENLKLRLTHFSDLDLDSIRNTTLKNEAPSSVISTFEQHETVWNNSKSERSVKEYGENVMETSDGLAWFNLNRPGCRVEANAMRHCGNGSGRPGQNIYSLRSRDPLNNKCWIPHVTLVMNDQKSGFTGEIKGYGNNKPEPRYWPSIVEFIKGSHVCKLEGGGYKPENNFDISDLDINEQQSLMEVKPSLFTYYNKWILNGMRMNVEIEDGLHATGNLVVNSENRIEVIYGNGFKNLTMGLSIDNVWASGLASELDRPWNIAESYSQLDINNELCCKEITSLMERKHPLISLISDYIDTKYSAGAEPLSKKLVSAQDYIIMAGFLAKEHEDRKLSKVLIEATRNAAISGRRQQIESLFENVIDDVNKMYGERCLSFDKKTGDWDMSFSAQELISIYHEFNQSHGKKHHEDNILDAVKDHIRKNNYTLNTDSIDNSPVYCAEKCLDSIVRGLEVELSGFKYEKEIQKMKIAEPFDDHVAKSCATQRFISRQHLLQNDMGL